MQKAIANGCLNVRNIGAKGVDIILKKYILS